MTGPRAARAALEVLVVLVALHAALGGRALADRAARHVAAHVTLSAWVAAVAIAFTVHRLTGVV